MANYFQTDDRDDYFASLDNRNSWGEFKQSNIVEHNKQLLRNKIKKEMMDKPIENKSFEDEYLNKPSIEIKPKIQLNESQEVALKALVDWSHSVGKENLFATLKGSAGTGKTTITKEFIDKCKFKYGVVVSAPTHKAKKVIERATGLKSFTIQKLLGLRPNTELDDFDINFPQFDSGADSEIQYFKMLVIDESSMLNTDLFDLIVKEATRYNVKVLFIGDELQIPPVNETASKALTHVNLVVELTVIVRQKDSNPLADLLIAIRHDILNGTDTFEQLINETPININENEGYAVLTAQEFQLKMKEEFGSEEYITNKDYCKYTAWANKSVQGSNKMVRSFLTDTQDALVLGDVMMGYKTITDMYEGTFITNSEEYIVHEIAKHINDFGLNGYLAILKYLDSETNVYHYTRSLFIVDPSDYKNFMKLHDEKLHIATTKKGSAWKQYYAFKNYNLLLSDIMDNNNKLLVKKDLDYGYGVTVHKSQGSTYKNVFVNLKNIRMNSNKVERKQITYVSLSRASGKVYIFDKL